MHVIMDEPLTDNRKTKLPINKISTIKATDTEIVKQSIKVYKWHKHKIGQIKLPLNKKKFGK